MQTVCGLKKILAEKSCVPEFGDGLRTEGSCCLKGCLHWGHELKLFWELHYKYLKSVSSYTYLALTSVRLNPIIGLKKIMIKICFCKLLTLNCTFKKIASLHCSSPKSYITNILKVFHYSYLALTSLGLHPINDVKNSMIKKCFWKGLAINCASIFKTFPGDKNM